MRTFGNIIWHFPFLGFLQSLIYAIGGVFWCLTVIGIPLGLGLFQLSLFTLSPFSKRMVSRHDLELITGEKQEDVVKVWFLIVRILYFPLGLIMAFFSVISIGIQFISIFGIPCAMVQSKALATIFNPVNKKCVPLAVAEEIERRKVNNVLDKYEKRTPVQSTTTAVPDSKINEAEESQITSPASVHAPVQQEIPVQQVSPNLASTNVTDTQPVQISQPSPVTPSYQTPTSAKRNNALIIGIAIGVLALVGFIAGYFMWYAPYAKDRDALRTYVVANNVFLRSSKVAGVEYNILSKVPYGSELITYSKDMEWAEIKVNGVKGFVASSFLLEWNDFKLLNDVWGSTDTKEYIESSKCRLAILDYCKRNQFNTGNEGWQLYTLQKNVKPNNVLFPRLDNGYAKFTEFAFILKNNATQERRFAIYSFDEETEQPVFLYDENAPGDGQIKNVKYINGRNEYNVTYTGNNAVVKSKEAYTQQQTPNVVKENPYVPVAEAKEEKPVIVEDDKPTGSNDVATTNADDNSIYETVEQMPEYPDGGMAGLMKFISKNLEYPAICQESGVQGKVVVSFVVNKDGSITDFRIVRSVDKHLDKEALRVLNSMPKWKPGKRNGVPVRVKYTIPINFRLS